MEGDKCPFEVPYVPGPGALEAEGEGVGPGALKKEILKEGEGEEMPPVGSKVVVHYTGRLAQDGTKFDSSKDAGREPFQFVLGKGEVIKAWDAGVSSMKKGEIARFTCRSDVCYGERGSPPTIPPNADLIFDVECIDWKGEDISKDQDEGILRTTIVPSKGYMAPGEGSVVKIHAVGKYEGKVFFDKEMEFRLDYGEAEDLPRGVEEGLYKFHKGEKSVLQLKPKYGFGAAGRPDFGIPPNAPLVYEVTLHEFVRAKERWEMDNEEKVKQAGVFKQLGTNFFQKGQFQMAEAKYKKAVDYLDDGAVESDDEKKQRQELLLTVRLNLGLVYLKMDEEKQAVEQCSKALEIDPNNEKALFRRGQALLKMHDPELAVQDFNKVHELNAENKAAIQQIAICKKAIADQKQKDKMIYRKMFESLGSGDKGNNLNMQCPKPEEWKEAGQMNNGNAEEDKA